MNATSPHHENLDTIDVTMYDMDSSSCQPRAQVMVSPDVMMQDADETTRPKGLLDIPYDIIVQIYSYDLCAATCLGLTCTKLYAFLKLFHPREIPLSLPICDCNSDKAHRVGDYICASNHTLAHLLQPYFGPSYRLLLPPFVHFGFSRYYPVRFLSTAIYGPHHLRNKRQERLWFDRYDSYVSSYEHENPKFHLPKPFNKGKDWDEEAGKVIRDTARYFADFGEWKRYWEGFEVWGYYRKGIVGGGRMVFNVPVEERGREGKRKREGVYEEDSLVVKRTRI